MPNPLNRVPAVDVPAESAVTTIYASTQLADAFAVRLPAGATRDPETLARFILERQPAGVDGLMQVRDAVVGGLGLKTAKQLRAEGAKPGAARIGIFRIYETRPHEIILGEDDKHLDFRASVLVRPEPGHAPGEAGGAQQVVVSTVVHCHNLLGRSYLTLIAPFHRQVVQAGLRRAVRSGWPLANTGAAGVAA
jgi:hypothetical protein